MGILISERRGLTAAQPHLATKTGKSVTIKNSVPRIDGIRLFFGPDYKGSGTPSGSNVRTIDKAYTPVIYVDGVAVQVAPTTTGGVYGGVYDSKTGILTKSWSMQTATGGSEITSFVNRGEYSTFWVYSGNLVIYNSPDATLLSNMFTWAGSDLTYDNIPVWGFSGNHSYPQSCVIKVPTSVLPEASLAGVKAWVASNNIQICAPYRYTAPTVDLGVKTHTVGRGQHTITIDEGHLTDTYFIDNVEVTYWTN